MTWPRQEFADFNGGLVDGFDPSQIADNAASSLANVDLSDQTIAKRRGSIKVNHTAQPQPGLVFGQDRDAWGFVAHEAAQLPTADFQIEFWMEPSAVPGSSGQKRVIVYKGSNGLPGAAAAVNLGTGDVFCVYLEHNGSTVEIALEYVVQTGPTVVKWRTTAQSFAADVAHHIAWHRDSGANPTSGRCIVDGLSVTVANIVGADDGSDLVQGTMPMVVGAATENALGRVDPLDTSNSSIYRGLLDELRVWSVFRSAATTATTKDRELVAADVSSDLLSYWKMNDGSLYNCAMSSLATATAGIALHPRRPTWVDGLFNEAPGFKAVQLDGYQQFIEIDIGQSTLTGATIAREATQTKKPQARMYDLWFGMSQDTSEQAAPVVGRYSWVAGLVGTNWTFEVAFSFNTLSASTDNWIVFWEALRGDATHNRVLKIRVDSAGLLQIDVSSTDATNANPETYSFPAVDWVGGARPTITAGTKYMITVVRASGIAMFAFLHDLSSTQEESSTTAGGNGAAFTVGNNWGPGTDATWDTGSQEGVCGNILLGTNAVDSGASTTLRSHMKVQELRVWSERRATGKTTGLFEGIWKYNHEPLDRNEHVERVTALQYVSAAGPVRTLTTPLSALIGYWPMTEDWREYNTNNRQAVQDLGRMNVPIPFSIPSGVEMELYHAGAPGILHPQSHTPVFGEGLVIGEDKRPPVDGIFNFIQTDGTQELLTIQGAQARRLDLSGGVPGATTLVVDSRFMPTRLVSFAKFADRVYGGNGLDPNVRFDEERSVVDFQGVIPPEVAPQTLSRFTGTGTETPGDVQYMYTYFSSSTNIESNPSPFSTVIRPTINDRVLLRLARPRQRRLSGTKAYHVDRIRIYRTYHNNTTISAEVPGSGTYHFIKEIGLPADAQHYAEWEDDRADTVLGLAFPFDELTGDFQRGFPQPMQYMVTHNGRLYGAGDPASPNTLYFSEPLLPDAWPSLNSLDLEGSTGQIIRGLVSLLGNLYIFTQSSTWVLAGTGPTNFQLLLIDGQIGCTSHFSISVIENAVYFASHRGPYRFDGARFEFLGDAITGRTNSTWEDVDSAQLEKATGGFLERQGLYLLGVGVTPRDV